MYRPALGFVLLGAMFGGTAGAQAQTDSAFEVTSVRKVVRVHAASSESPRPRSQRWE